MSGDETSRSWCTPPESSETLDKKRCCAGAISPYAAGGKQFFSGVRGLGEHRGSEQIGSRVLVAFWCPLFARSYRESGVWVSLRRSQTAETQQDRLFFFSFAWTGWARLAEMDRLYLQVGIGLPFCVVFCAFSHST